MRKTTTHEVLKCLKEIFSRNGYPRTLISDNGPQFTGKVFDKFCDKHGIKHICSAPYRPQSNGLVERLHGSLVPLIHKYCENSRGEWHEVIQLALYFLRMSPNASIGYSPYMIVHGWEPASPIEVLQQGWLDSTMKGIDVYEWVRENSERVEA